MVSQRHDAYRSSGSVKCTHELCTCHVVQYTGCVTNLQHVQQQQQQALGPWRLTTGPPQPWPLRPPPPLPASLYQCSRVHVYCCRISMATPAEKCKQQALRPVLRRQCTDIPPLPAHALNVCKCRLSQSAIKVKAKMLLEDMLPIAPSQIRSSQIIPICRNGMTQMC